MNRIKLGVNIDHVATLRQARGTHYPEPIYAALIAEDAGADVITVHLREDLRHIQKRDVYLLRDVLNIPLNLEMAATPNMIDFLALVKPQHCCVVPENRMELTTEGGLDVLAQRLILESLAEKCKALSIQLSLFVDPDLKQIEAAKKVGADVIELHTGGYADATTPDHVQQELEKLFVAAKYAKSLRLQLHAGHGLHLRNIQPLLTLPNLKAFNIGHSIVSDAIFCGMKHAVQRMLMLLQSSEYGFL